MTAVAEPYLLGADLRKPWNRRAAFLRFYDFHLRWGTHPGCVYFLIPWLRARLGWDVEDALWFAFLNGNTQHPATSLRLMEAAPSWQDGHRLAGFLDGNWGILHWDTDRRYQKKDLGAAVASYTRAVQRAGTQERMWHDTGLGWPALWAHATAFHSFGRLAAFSYLEYVRLVLDRGFDCTDLLLEDRAGSRSHRNGLCILLGHDKLDWHASNPDFDGVYPPEFLGHLRDEAARLLDDALVFCSGDPWVRDVSYFTLESALCTYKSFHRPDRRYPNVYADMLYNRLRSYEETPGMEAICALLWEARVECLPDYLRLENMPYDPGLSPVKQNWYRLHGELPMMSYDYPELANGFDRAVAAETFGLRPH